MKKILKIFLIIIGSIIGLLLILIAFLRAFEEGKQQPPVEKKEVFESANLSIYPSELSVQGNDIVNADDKKIMLKGIMAPDPQKIDFDGNFSEDFYKKIFSYGGNVIRIPVHPERYISDEYYLWRYLDKIVAWAGENGQYVVIDLHFIGNPITGYGNEMANVRENPKNFALKFWKQTAAYFKDVPNIIFEIYNEPAFIEASDWNGYADELISAIRKTGAEQLIIVGGIDYACDLSWVKTSPIADKNVAYAAHVFPSKKNWDNNFGDIADSYPVIVTEWGYIDENRNTTKQSYLIGDQDNFGDPLIKYMKEHDIGWIACWYDDGWEPEMFTENFKSTTNWGRFVFEQLK